MQPNDAGNGTTTPGPAPAARHDPDLVDEPVPGEVEAYWQAVEDDVTRRLPDEAVAGRLARLERAADRRSGLHDDDLAGIVRDQVRYAYQVVACWLTVVFDPALPDLSARIPTYDDVDVIARETVARAVVSFREELTSVRPWLGADDPDLPRVFLQECLLHLPDAHQQWLRTSRQLSWDDVEQIGTGGDAVDPARLLRRLDDQVRNHRGWVIERLRHVRFPDAGDDDVAAADRALAEILDATVETLDAAIREWAPGGRP